MTLFGSITTLCGTECGEYQGTFHKILSVSRNIVVDLHNVIVEVYEKQTKYGPR